jgi:EAL domain-containing protein (putative c-di-GMP-specific phosphodiesterase class I)
MENDKENRKRRKNVARERQQQMKIMKKLRVNKIRGMLATFSSQFFSFSNLETQRLNYVHAANEFLGTVEGNGKKLRQKM